MLCLVIIYGGRALFHYCFTDAGYTLVTRSCLLYANMHTHRGLVVFFHPVVCYFRLPPPSVLSRLVVLILCNIAKLGWIFFAIVCTSVWTCSSMSKSPHSRLYLSTLLCLAPPLALTISPRFCGRVKVCFPP
ncbi:hypothetical protein KP509_18G071900 [Ceratopteris richardii]|uniref:Uncharacterized protein n=1 Tax=Ceratopteris richardii TaxID=49495 RepID=A0A8T2SQW7_CERRI|nr:hypothetical protein KP509_18G071900 [Ceratopteris richardii]